MFRTPSRCSARKAHPRKPVRPTSSSFAGACSTSASARSTCKANAPSSMPDIAALSRLADALGDDRRRSEVAWRRSDIAMRTGEFRAMESAAREAMSLAERAGDGVMKLRAQQHLASARALLGDLPAGKALAQDGLAASRSLQLRDVESLFLNTLS